MIYTYQIAGLTLKTGDLICTTDGKTDILPGEFWRFIGRFVPGDVDHIIFYLGPDSRCLEAAGMGVNTFDIPNGRWDTQKMALQRGLLFDSLYGSVSPLDRLGLNEEEENTKREIIASYCLAQIGKPYNVNFRDAETEESFYCSQLAYKAYQQVGINLNTGLTIEKMIGVNDIIFPQEIWEGFSHRRTTRDGMTGKLLSPVSEVE